MSRYVLVIAASALALVSCGSNGNYGHGTNTDPCAECADGACAAACRAGEGAWEGPVLLWQGRAADAPPCPEAAPDLLLEAYADLDDAPLPCGDCSCGPSLCSLPDRVAVRPHEECSDIDPNDPYMPLYTPEDWDGTCFALPTVDPTEFGSILIYGTRLSPCLPQQAPPVLPSEFPWATLGRVCKTPESLPSCDDPAVDCSVKAEPQPGPFVRCLRSVEEDQACPAGYSEARRLYGGIDDTRSCAPCACGPQSGAACGGYLSVFQDNACTLSAAGTALGPSPHVGCIPQHPPYEIKYVAARLLDVAPGICEPSGGEPVGEATPLDPTLFCCEAPGGTEESL